MATPDKSIDPRLFESAKKEFLEKGFEMASLSKICKNAGVTTGALYNRYKGKEDLFASIAAETVNEMNQVVSEKIADNISDLSDEQLYEAWNMTPESNLWWFRFLYDRKDGFTLLVKCSQGTRYGNFEHEWAERMNEIDFAYYQEAQKRGIAKSNISINEMHVLTSAYWSLIYEPFIHDFTWEEIEDHAHVICDYINWHKALKFVNPQK